MWRIALLIALLACVGIGMVLIRHHGTIDLNDDPPSEPALDRVALDALRPSVEAFCGDCHKMPDPNSFPKDGWFHEVERGFEFYVSSGRTDLKPPIRSDVVRYFQAQAPDSLVLPSSPPPETSGLTFRQDPRPGIVGGDTSAAISYLKIDGDKILVCDMRRKEFWSTSPAEDAPIELIASGGHYAHYDRCDLNGDGTQDFVLSDLGSFLPEDHNRGSVVWLQGEPDGSFKTPVVLADQLARVADARSADFDQDGDQDIVVAEFGYIETGSLFLLRNQGAEISRDAFQRETLDPRHGASHVPIAKNGSDPFADFFVLISQEYETIGLYEAKPDGGFDYSEVFSAPGPSFGSSGMELVDLDQDGDQDILYTNGDLYDSFAPKPYHSVQWIENADGKWTPHKIHTMPGVFRALPGDMDGDGDLDIVATGFIPKKILAQFPDVRFASIVWLEQTGGHQFVPHVIETDRTDYAAMDLGDLDGDGDVDIVVGNFDQTEDSVIKILWNESERG